MPISVNLAKFQVLFTLPIYLQSIHEQSAIKSGVNTISMVAFFAFGSVLSGFIISKTGHLQPLQLLSGLLATAGATLLYTLKVDFSLARYIGPQIILGLGIGIGNQIPMTVYQFFSESEHVHTNTGIMLMTNGMSGAFLVTAATTIFNNRMLSTVARLATNIDRQTVLFTGASKISKVFQGSDLVLVRRAYMVGIQDVFASSMAGPAMTAVLSQMNPIKKLPGHERQSLVRIDLSRLVLSNTG